MCQISTTIVWGLPINTESLMRGLIAYHEYSDTLKTLRDLHLTGDSPISHMPPEIMGMIESNIRASAWEVAEKTMQVKYQHLLKRCDCRLYAQTRVDGLPAGFHNPTVRSLCASISCAEWRAWTAFYAEFQTWDEDNLTMAQRYLPDFGVKMFMDLNNLNYNLHVLPLEEMEQRHTSLVYIPLHTSKETEPHWRPNCDACAACNPIESIRGLLYRPQSPLWESDEDKKSIPLAQEFGDRVPEWQRAKEGIFKVLVTELRLLPGRWSGTEPVWGEIWRSAFRPLFGGFNGVNAGASPWGGETGNTWVGSVESGWDADGTWVGPDPDVVLDCGYEPKGEWEEDFVVDGKVVRDTLLIRRTVDCNCRIWNSGKLDYN